MAKSKYTEVKRRLAEVEQWAREGLIDEEIARRLGISKTAYYDYQNKYTEFSDAIKRGKAVVDCQVQQSLFKRALGYTERLLKQKVTKDGDVVDAYEDVHIPADTTAQIFWLKNRMPDTWKDKQEVGVSMNTSESMRLMAEYIASCKGTGCKEP